MILARRELDPDCGRRGSPAYITDIPPFSPRKVLIKNVGIHIIHKRKIVYSPSWIFYIKREGGTLTFRRGTYSGQVVQVHGREEDKRIQKVQVH